ncbi:MAG: SIMPL domain-containing protein [Bacillus sp. (in: firmicutes)]
MNHPNAPLPVLTVTGNGKVMAQANAVQLQIEVITKGNDVTEAQQENAQNMNRVIQAITDVGIPKENIQTVVYTVSPTYNYIDGKQVFTGFEVINAISVKITDINQVGTVIDTAVQNGANRLSSLQFTVENPDYYYQQALSLALQNAQLKAKTIADTMQLSLHSQPIEIIEEDSSVPPILYKSAALSSTPIEQGQMTINAAVRVTFRY